MRSQANMRTAPQDGGATLRESASAAEELINTALALDPQQPLALHLHIHIAEAASPQQWGSYLHSASFLSFTCAVHTAKATRPPARSSGWPCLLPACTVHQCHSSLFLLSC